MPDNYTHLLIRILPDSNASGTYSVQADLDDGSRYQEGPVSLNEPGLNAHDAQVYGQELFDSIFVGDILRAYQAATARAAAQTHGRLRIQLSIDERAIKLQAVHWERLCGPHRDTPGLITIQTPFSRYTPLPIPEPSIITERPIKMLVAIANPRDWPNAVTSDDIEKEVENLRQGLGDLRQEDQLQVTLLLGRSKSSLRPERLTQWQDEGYRIEAGHTSLQNLLKHLPGQHIFHFIGHGALGRLGPDEPRRFALYLEKDDGTLAIARDDDLAAGLVARGDSLRLAFLVACESAGQTEQAGDAFLGLGPRLVRSGLPAVVAMQAKIPMERARVLTGEFYRRLLEHGTVDEALRQARGLIFDNKIADWAVPVLFMRLREGRLFTPRPISLAPRFCVPFLQNKRFVGREADLKRLHSALQQSGVPVMLTGLGGIGKTQLAVEYAHRHKDAYPGGIYWVQAGKIETDEALAELARLADEAELNVEAASDAQKAHQFLVYLNRRRDALLIVDNVEALQDMRTPLGTLTLARLQCKVLFTTIRNIPDGPDDDRREFAVLELRELPRDAALTLLLGSRARRNLLESWQAGQEEAAPEIAAAQAICRTLGDQPLALALASAYLGTYGEIPLADYGQRLKREGGLAVVDAHGIPLDLPTQHRAAVEATLTIQWNALSQAPNSEQARFVLKAAALLGKENLVPRLRLALFTGLSTKPQGGRGAPLKEALLPLHDLWLIDEPDKEKLNQRDIRLHPLVQEFAVKQVRAEGEAQFRQGLVEHVRAALIKPDTRVSSALIAAESLLDLPWLSDSLRPKILSALQVILPGEGKDEERRTASFALTRLDWLSDHQRVSPATMLTYLELMARFIVSEENRNYVIQRGITPLLTDEAVSLSPRQRAQLLIYRAALSGGMQKQPNWEAVANDYAQALQIIVQSLDEPEQVRDDYRLLARIKLGQANLAGRETRRLGRKHPDFSSRMEAAFALYAEALKAARANNQDVILEANIGKEWSWAYTFLDRWQEAVECYQAALAALRADQQPLERDPDAYLNCYAHVLETASNVHWEKGQRQPRCSPAAQSEYQTALDLAREEIALLEPRPTRQWLNLANAHLNAGDFLCALWLCASPEDRLQLEPKMRAHWQMAATLADERNLPDTGSKAHDRLTNGCRDEME